ncbi:hypothetical protein CPB85DRAFT_1311776 [Mucidula mucida]|nr:hypothetical protein CPB85DRAFT_1311776 [Mucidula mucida]
MAAECDVKTVVRRALDNAPTNWYARQWIKNNPTLGIPCNFCKARSLPCAPRLSRIHCSNPDCLSTSCSRVDEELFSRIKTMRPAREREEFDTVLARIRTKDAQSTPLTLRICRFPTREMPPYPSPISSSTTPASDEEEDPTIRDLAQTACGKSGTVTNRRMVLQIRVRRPSRIILFNGVQSPKASFEFFVLRAVSTLKKSVYFAPSLSGG